MEESICIDTPEDLEKHWYSKKKKSSSVFKTKSSFKELFYLRIDTQN